MKTLTSFMTIAAIFMLAGCASIEDTAYKATGTVVITANAAMSEWLDYKNTMNPSVDQVLKVKAAWDKYYALVQLEKASVVTYKTNAGTNTLNLAVSMVAAASSELINVVMQFLPPARVAKLKGVK